MSLVRKVKKKGINNNRAKFARNTEHGNKRNK